MHAHCFPNFWRKSGGGGCIVTSLTILTPQLPDLAAIALVGAQALMVVINRIPTNTIILIEIGCKFLLIFMIYFLKLDRKLQIQSIGLGYSSKRI